MNAIHIHKVIDSETLHLPELKSLIGATVDIIVVPSSATGPGSNIWLPGFWDAISKGWQGEPLVRPPQGECDSRDALQ